MAELKAAAARAIITYRTELLDRQLVLERLANMAIELFATAAAVRASGGYFVTDSILEMGTMAGSGVHGHPEDRLSEA